MVGVCVWLCGHGWCVCMVVWMVVCMVGVWVWLGAGLCGWLVCVCGCVCGVWGCVVGVWMVGWMVGVCMVGVRMASVRMAGGQRDAKWFQIRHTGDARACRFSFILCKVQWISECKKVDTNILTVGGSLCRGSLCRWLVVSWSGYWSMQSFSQ